RVALEADGAPLPLTVGEDGVISAKITMPADSRALLRLQYGFDLADPLLPALRYSPLLVRAWPGSISMAVQLVPSQEIAAESQLRIEPADWSFEPIAGSTDAQIRWLYDGRVPGQTFLFQFIAPAVWRDLQSLEQSAGADADIATYNALGNLYRRLYEAAVGQEGGHSERFYAQALAAYTEGITFAGTDGTAKPERASLHTGLAQLYRARVLSATGSVANGYAGLMADEAAAALALLPADAASRSELEQWQAEGLRLRLQDAREARDWSAAIKLLDRLAQLPADAADPAVLADQRQDVMVQQALQLLELDQREAAMAVAGEQLTSQDLLPPENTRTLFASWDVTTTLTLDRASIELVGVTYADRHDAAREAALELVDNWQTALSAEERRAYQVDLDERVPANGASGAMTLRVEFPSDMTALALARSLPSQADWALLRTLLLEVSPHQSVKRGLLWQEVTLSQPLDLATTGEQWKNMAANLTRQADLFELQALLSTRQMQRPVRQLWRRVSRRSISALPRTNGRV
ncbi:MAG: hypothetical protein HC802_17540, partial [Caldilineaceae bacterium]|nr:hypothetical protein [Caldilineaceae bacterium]